MFPCFLYDMVFNGVLRKISAFKSYMIYILKWNEIVTFDIITNRQGMEMLCMRCSSCQEKIDDHAVVCIYCGKAVNHNLKNEEGQYFYKPIPRKPVTTDYGARC